MEEGLVIQKSSDLLTLQLPRYVLVRANVSHSFGEGLLSRFEVHVDQRNPASVASFVIFGVAVVSTGLTMIAFIF